jgi:hypothetical protein
VKGWPAALLVGLCACAAVRPPAESSRPSRWDSVAELLPPDLDVVVRIGWPRLRASPLYALASSALPERAGAVALATALERARAVVVGARVMPDGLRGDGVLVIETDETELDQSTIRRVLGGSASPPRASPRGAVVHEAGAPPGRTDPVLLVVVPRTGLLLATAAEADAVLRVLERGPLPGKLEPPATGLLSFALRSPRGGAWAPGSRDLASLRPLAEGAETARGTLDLVDDGVKLSAQIRYGAPELATRAAERGRSVIQTLASGTGPWADAARQWKTGAALAVENEILVVSLTIPFGLLVGRR